MEAVFLHRVGFLEYFCPKQGQDFVPLAPPLYPNMGQVPPPPLREKTSVDRLDECLAGVAGQFSRDSTSFYWC